MKACENCQCFAAEANVPIGEGAAETCWLCAHSLIVHRSKLGEPITLCDCKADDIYPAPVLLRQAELGIERTISDKRPSLKLEVAKRYNLHRPRN